MPDPLPAGARVTSITASVKLAKFWPDHYTWAGIPNVSTSLNGTPIGAYYTLTSYASSCDYAGTHSFYSDYYPDGFPGYLYGGSNSFGLTVWPNNSTKDTAALNGAVTLTITYVMAETVFIDVDGSFDPLNPVDDLPQFVPGSRINGSSIPFNEMPQELSVHVLTPIGQRGDIQFELTDVSYWPGMAMNFPLNSTDTSADMDFGSGILTRKVKINAKTGVTTVPMYVRDYGALGTLKVTVPNGNKTTYTTTKRLPRDANGNGLPDAGWTAGSTSVSDGGGAADDVDSVPAGSGSPSTGILGDGLSRFEEYRGFVVAGEHTRLDPTVKDLFLLPDQHIKENQLHIFAFELPLAIHIVTEDEAVTTPDGRSPWINPNNGGVPGGATGQKGLAVMAALPGTLVKLLDGGIVPVGEYKMLKGATFLVTENPMLVDLSVPDSERQSPNQVQSVEFYPENHEGSIMSYADAPVKPVIHPDDVDAPTLMIIYPGPNHVLDTALCAGCYLTDIADDCSGYQIVPYSVGEFQDLTRFTVAHEIGHGVDIEHTECVQSSVMDEATLPLATGYSALDSGQIRIHREY